MRISGHDVIRAVCGRYGLTRADLTSTARYRSIARPRQVAFYLMRENCPHLSLPAIGRLFGGRDHTTVLHGERMIKSLLLTDDRLQADVDALRLALANQGPASGWGIYEAHSEPMRSAA